MKVYRTHRASFVHFSPDCCSFKSYRKKRPLVEYELHELKSIAGFCTNCTPQELWELPKTHHSICDICHQSRPFPCPHNGGVPVVDMKYYGDHRVYSTAWRWPENVYGALLVDPSILV